jgi:peptidoglycan pentaglycine glycine transferase (the first glycine)
MPPSTDDWDAFASAHPQAHILQTGAWGRLKASFGWRARPIRSGPAGGLLLLRRLAPGLSLGYVPRGPLADWTDATALAGLRDEMDRACRAERAICLKWEPGLPDAAECAAALERLGFRRSPHPVQPRRTLVVDLRGSEAEVLGRMKQKTRYNIGLASKKGVKARPASGPADLQAFAGLMAETAARDRFGAHAPDYYRRAYELFNPAGQCELLLAEFEGQALAAVMAFALGGRAWYFYGASSDRERSRMAPYLAQWEAMRWARAQGARSYDLWGVPDEDETALEARFQTRSDGLWGVYRFKRGFGGRLERSIGAWDRVYNPLLYRAYLFYARRRSEAA